MSNDVKIAPNSKESEMMVLGCMLTQDRGLKVGAEKLKDSDFYYTEHAILFQVMKQAYKNGQAVDLHLVSEELKRQVLLKSIGGLAYITTVAQFSGTSANVEEYAEIVKQKSFSRQMINLCTTGRDEFLNDPENPTKTAEKYHRNLIELEKRYTPSERVSIGDILTGNKSRIDPSPLIDRLRDRQQFYKEHGKPFLTGIPTGFMVLDNKVTVLEDTNLIIIAGRPAMGKTAFALNILANISFDQKLPVGFISLEMGADQLVERLLSMRSGIDGEKIKRGTFIDDELNKLVNENERLKEAKFYIHDQSIGSISQVVSRARKLKEEEDIRILAIDYLQLLGTDGGKDSRQYEVAEVSRTLKQLAMELKIPIIVVAQLSRKVEERQNKRPLMSDLRDSGQIEQDADSIMFVYRKDYYDPNDKKGHAEIILAKNRHGPEASVNLSFRSGCGAFGNLAPLEQATRVSVHLHRQTTPGHNY